MFSAEKKRIYFDYASATPVRKEAREAYVAALATFGNPSSLHKEGVEADAMLERAREGVAASLGVKAREVVFVSGGSEANNLALLGFARALEKEGKLAGAHFLVSGIEHPSVLACAEEAKRLGAEVSFVGPDRKGVITPDAVASALKTETRFASIGLANGEIGVVQPIARIAQVIRAHEARHGTRVIFHTDAGQAPLYRPAQPHSLGVDLMTLDAGKLYAPRGTGVLVVARDDIPLAPLILGGGQEKGLRAGTEHTAGAAAFAAALRAAASERTEESARVLHLRDILLKALNEGVPGLVVNGALEHALPHILNVSVPGVSSEYLALALDADGVAVSTKSACKEGEEGRSHVVEALTLDNESERWRAASTIRFSLGSGTSEKDVRRAGESFVQTTQRIRA